MNFENIPAELRRRDQWLFWNASRETPKAPLNKPRSQTGCAWSDPETWMAFTDVAERARATENAGIGYVNAADNDDFVRGLFGIIDIDGAVDDDGRPADWLPSLKPFFDRGAYAEWSPSSEGIHIPVVGIEAPEWWSDQHIDDEEHTGVEVLTNKFATCTGEQMDGAGDEVVEYGDWLDEWLREVYKAINGEGPESELTADSSDTASSSSTRTNEEWITRDVAKDALSYIDPSCGYKSWRNIGFALGSHFSDRTAARLMNQWSRRSSKYDGDAEGLIDDIVSRGDNGGTDIAHLVNRAKQGGWDASAAAKKQFIQMGDDDSDGSDTAREADNKTDESDTQPNVQSETDEWDDVVREYKAAEDTDEKLRARETATRVIDSNQHWRSLLENDVLYHYDESDGTFSPTGEARLRETLVDKLGAQFRTREKNEIAAKLRGLNTIPQEKFGGEPNKICTNNCVIHVDRDEIRREPHNPDYNFLYKVDTDFDPEADCPRFRSFLEEVVQTGADRKKLQEYAGYVLYHWGLPFHKTLFLVGPTASGKSTFLDTVRSLLGSGAVASLTPQQMTAERFAGAQLYGAMANIRNDIPVETVDNAGQFKEIAAGDELKAEEKFKDPFKFEPHAKHLFAANQLPEIDTDDQAFYRRILLCAFPETVPRDERDRRLDDKLQSELPGILNWALEGLQRLLTQNKFTADRIPGQTQDTWEKWANSISRFAKIGLEDADGDCVPKSDAYSAYVNYCETESIPLETQHKFTRKLKSQGIKDGRKRVKGKQKRVFLNVRLTDRGRDLVTDSGGSGVTLSNSVGDDDE